ncbi:MAG: NAD(+)/NADH kinase [Treponema sp.]|nr:NAD(+)/NADH kinase [Treponema sp.]
MAETTVKSAILIINLHKENAASAAEEIRRELESRGTETTLFALEGRPDSPPKGRWDIAFSLGGDGTVLYTARILAHTGTPILPVHLGTLGFIAVVDRHEWPVVYRGWLTGEKKPSRRCMLEFSIERGGKYAVNNSVCLNDVVISSLGIAKLIRLQAKTEVAPGEFAEIGCYRSDGLIIATPTGSTAYSMAAGGPILDPEMEAQIISPICPFTLSNRPLVLPSRQTLQITVCEDQRSGVLLTCDGQETFDLEPGDLVTIKHSPHYALLITSGYSSYYKALAEKLAWASGGVSTGGIVSTGGAYA